MGRPSKLTPETQARIVQAIEVGATYELAAQFGGVCYDTFNNWMRRGEAEQARRDNPRVQEGTKVWDDEQPYLQFFEAVKSAEGKAAIKWLALIDKAASDSWQAAAWKLERRYPETFGRRVVQQEVSGKDGGAIEVNDGLTDAERSARIAAIFDAARARRTG